MISQQQRPLNDGHFKAKFHDCAQNALHPLSDASIDTALAAIGRLETLADARDLLTPFAD